MNDERDRILKLLEDGKITADQAARLIEALGVRRTEFEMPPVPPIARMVHRRHGFREMDRIPELVAHAVSSAVRSGFEADETERSNEFPGSRNLFVRTVSGDVEVAGTADEKVSVSYGGGMVKVRSTPEGVQVRSVSGDVEGRMPATGALEAETVSGDISAEDLSGRLTFKSVSGDVNLDASGGQISAYTVSGDIELARVLGEVNAESRSGDIELRASGPFSGRLVTKSGDITLLVPPNVDGELELECEESGDVEVQLDLPHEIIEQRGNFARIKLGAGGPKLVARTHSADITVQDAEEE
jgi:DUF4097 and DUF4098 domain-containing protein YvlB